MGEGGKEGPAQHKLKLWNASLKLCNILTAKFNTLWHKCSLKYYKPVSSEKWEDLLLSLALSQVIDRAARSQGLARQPPM